ncbi:helix-turn-helix domain-containing protein [Fibrella sp. WM1]|uniref:helix-turn-helix domain-containing protein n=1 Tax=Fibrella musci TaxID=3242485 RepID=UPI00352058C7
MTFYFSAYSTPLLFGFIQAWIYALLLWYRGFREERLSDKLLGCLLVGLAFAIWVYMLGFGGIEILWQQLEFFPRDIGLLLGPLVYFYLKSQLDATFRLRWRDLWHAVPFLINVSYHILVFAQGTAFVQQWEQTVHNPLQIGAVEYWFEIGQQFVYLCLSFLLYRDYRVWIKNQFSETDSISFRWYRNFLIASAVTIIANLLVNLFDLWYDLDFWHDWWGNLVTVMLIYYVSIEGYAQVQTGRKLTFRPDNAPSLDSSIGTPLAQPAALPELVNLPADNGPVKSVAAGANRAETALPDLPERLTELLAYMAAEKPYLEPDLALPDLARRLHTNPVLLSQVINAGTGKNFNDFVNEYRVEEFKRQVREPANAHLSFLGLALDCGFNSKATFNRAFKKFTGLSPKEFVVG